MQTFTVTGENGYFCLEIDSADDPIGSITQRIRITAPVPPYLYAAITDPVTGSPPNLADCTMTLTGPDSTVYNQDRNTPNLLVLTQGGKLVAACIAAPAAGLWTLEVTCTQSASYRAVLQTVAATNSLDTAMVALTPYFPDTTNQPGARSVFELSTWGLWSAAALLALAAKATRQMNLTSLIGALLTVDATVAGEIFSLIGPQNTLGTVTTFCRKIDKIDPSVVRQVIQNGDASGGLADWTILSGQGVWQVLYLVWTGSSIVHHPFRIPFCVADCMSPALGAAD